VGVRATRNGQGCDMGAESMARARMVGGDRANRLDPRVSGRGA
jgi:hypothetical protein